MEYATNTAAEDALMASLLLGTAVPVPQPRRQPKRARADSAYSLDALSEVAGARNGEYEQDSEDTPADSDDAQEDMTGMQDAAAEEDGIMPTMELSAQAAEFYRIRRAAMEAAASAEEAVSDPSALVFGVLTPEQAAVLNLDGRVGIYWPYERSYILERFLTKRDRRGWAKKIRYGCRKSLADKRIRVKGRFVRAELAAEIAETAVAEGAGAEGAAAALAGTYIPGGAGRADALRHAVERGSAYSSGAVQRRGRALSIESCAGLGLGYQPHTPNGGVPRASVAPASGRVRSLSFSHPVISAQGGAGGKEGHAKAPRARADRDTASPNEEGEGGSAGSSSPFVYEQQLPLLAGGTRKRPRALSVVSASGQA